MEQATDTYVGSVLAAVCSGIESAVGAAWWRCSDAEIRSAIVDLDREAARLDAARARLLAEAQARDVGAVSGAASTGDWYALATGSRPEKAGAEVALAVALQGDLAATGAALAAGDLTGDHAEVIHRCLTRLHVAVDAETRAEAETFLLQRAVDHPDPEQPESGVVVPALDPRRLARLAVALRHRLDPERRERQARAEDTSIALRELTLVEDDDGTWHLHGRLDAEAGARVQVALDSRSAPLPACTEGTPDRRPARQRRADALVQVVDEWLADGGAPGGGGGASRPQLVVTVTAETLAADPATAGVEPATAGGACAGLVLSAATAQILACDAAIVPILLGPDGTPLDVGRTRYTFPDRIRRAILARDQTCTKCGRPGGWLQIHHLQPHSTGGATSERNGAAACPTCHRIVHRHHWRGHLHGAQVIWHPPGRGAPVIAPTTWKPAVIALVSRWRQRTHPVRA